MLSLSQKPSADVRSLFGPARRRFAKTRRTYASSHAPRRDRNRTCGSQSFRRRQRYSVPGADTRSQGHSGTLAQAHPPVPTSFATKLSWFDLGGVRVSWTDDLIRQAYRDSSAGMQAILRTLASRPGEWLTVAELAEGMPSPNGREPAGPKNVGGALGGFAYRFKRQGQTRGLFDVRFEPERSLYRMGKRVASVILVFDER